MTDVAGTWVYKIQVLDMFGEGHSHASRREDDNR